MNSILNRTDADKAAIGREADDGGRAGTRPHTRERRRRVERDEQEARREERRVPLTSAA